METIQGTIPYTIIPFGGAGTGKSTILNTLLTGYYYLHIAFLNSISIQI